VLFVDTVDSTPTAERLGDSKWRELLERNADVIRREVSSARGRQVKTDGDGFLATFDSPARAVRCAQAVRRALRGVGLEVRAGIHLGEVEVIGADVAGIAVHVASRVESLADPGTILVTSTVREAMTGSGLPFSPRGAHRLKGVADEWQLFAIDD
jgi:class 3 adenylate cyclase